MWLSPVADDGQIMEKVALVAPDRPLLVACSVYWPGAETLKSLKVATPLTALCARVPLNDPVPEPVLKFSVTVLFAALTSWPF